MDTKSSFIEFLSEAQYQEKAQAMIDNIAKKNKKAMQLTYRLNSQEMSVAFLDSLKNLFVKQEIEITVRPLNDIDQTTVLSQTALSEEWDSIEDQRWDKLL